MKEPLQARKLSTRIRAWQVSSDALTANPHWLTTNRVAKSGIAWGDDEDPVEEQESKKRKIASGPSEPRKRTATRRQSVSTFEDNDGLFS